MSKKCTATLISPTKSVGAASTGGNWRLLIVVGCVALATTALADSKAFNFPEKGGREPYLVKIRQPGEFRAAANWAGEAKIRLSLYGPGKKTPYAEVRGESPLTLAYQVMPEDMGRGGDWLLWVATEGRGGALGQVEYSAGAGGARSQPLPTAGGATGQKNTSAAYGFTMRMLQYAVFDPYDEAGDDVFAAASVDESGQARWAMQLGAKQKGLKANSFCPLHSGDQAIFGLLGVPMNPSKYVDSRLYLIRGSEELWPLESEDVSQTAALYGMRKTPDAILGEGYAASNGISAALDREAATLRKLKADKKLVDIEVKLTRDDLLTLTQGDGFFETWLIQSGAASAGTYDAGVELRFDRRPAPVGPDSSDAKIGSLKIVAICGPGTDPSITTPLIVQFGADKKLTFELSPGRRGFSAGDQRAFVLRRTGKGDRGDWPFGPKLGDLQVSDLKSLSVTMPLEHAKFELKGLKVWADGRPVYANLEIGYLFEPGATTWKAADFGNR